MNLDDINKRPDPNEIKPKTWWQLVKDLIGKARDSMKDIEKEIPWETQKELIR